MTVVLITTFIYEESLKIRDIDSYIRGAVSSPPK